MKIKDILTTWLLEERNIGSACSFSTTDFWNIMGVIDGTAKEFIVFDNRGGKHFTIWTNKQCQSITEMVKFLNKKYPHSIFMYKVNGKEFILKELPKLYIDTSLQSIVIPKSLKKINK